MKPKNKDVIGDILEKWCDCTCKDEINYKHDLSHAKRAIQREIEKCLLECNPKCVYCSELGIDTIRKNLNRKGSTWEKD